MLDNRTNAVVPSSATFFYHLDTAGLEINIVMQNKNMFFGNFKIVGESTNTFARSVHIPLWFQHENLSAKDPTLTIQALHFQGIYLPPLKAGEKINKEKTDIVSG